MRITILIIVLVVGFGLFWVFSNKSAVISNLKLTMQPMPTPFAFQEVTIPYLRKKVYSSRLNALEKYDENSLYTTYITSYMSEGLKINGLLTVPKNDNVKFPAIVFVHGYILPNQYVTTQKYEDYVDYFARNGFVVFKIDLRGHGDSQGQAGGGYFGGDYITDTLNAYSALQSASSVDPKKVGLWGHSMAGNVVLRSLVVKPEIPATVIWAGAVYSYADREKYGLNDSSFSPSSINPTGISRRLRLTQTHGLASSGSAFWKQMAPTNYLSDIKGAIEIHHAVDDPVVNIGYSRDLIALLDKTKVPHTLYEYEGGGHNINGASFGVAMQRSVEFFKKYLR